MKILFVDGVAPQGYTCNSMRERALGGSEATLLRVARGLAKEGHSVSVLQTSDPERGAVVVDGIQHIGVEARIEAPDAIIHMRTAMLVEGFREEYPAARHIVWLHDNLGVEQCLMEPFQGEEVVCVSDWHADTFLKAEGGTVKKVHRIYNPVEIDGHRLDKIEGRLGFFSSPHKGFTQVKAAVFEARKTRPDLHLAYANPGYLPDYNGGKTTWCVDLGQLSHARLLEEMSKCEILFYPQTVFGETFGLVLAEASAMGVPVLCHDFGAAREVLEHSGNHEVVDCTNFDNVHAALNRILSRKSTAIVDPRFSLSSVIECWNKLLGA
jgi:glycosyltransferase involved in cell wall biosynthesis